MTGIGTMCGVLDTKRYCLLTGIVFHKASLTYLATSVTVSAGVSELKVSTYSRSTIAMLALGALNLALALSLISISAVSKQHT